jgi:hypothetical protein
MKNYCLIIILFFLSASCKKNNNNSNSTNTLKISGKIQNNTGVTSSNITVQLDGFQNYSTTTDVNGYFEFNNVEKGLYTLKSNKSLGDSLFVGNCIKFRAEKDTCLCNLKLPKPVIIYPGKDITSRSARIQWSQVDSTEFYEYKVYRKQDMGLDENSGKLIYVGTSPSDTEFVDNSLLENSTYYYRVYIMNNYGKVSGSKLCKITT